MYTARILRFAGLLLVSLGFCAHVQGQRLYKYQDENGEWAYSDRQPGGMQDYEEAELERRLEKAEVRLFQTTHEDGWVLMAENTYFGPVQVAYRLARMENIDSRTPRQGLQVLPGRSESELLRVARGEVAKPSSFEYEFQFIPGDPEARHQPSEPYRLPYARASHFHVSQAYPERITHGDPSSRHAIDFMMPVGTGVYAARSGVVIDVAGEFYRSGTDMSVDGSRANIVRVLHDDGTMTLYAHLNWNSIRVVPGQRVERGEYLADSGNTGYSTGPHLHFVVQRNSGGAIASVPIRFEVAGGETVTLRSGDEPTAY